MRIPQFDLGAEDDRAFEMCRSYLQSVTDGGLRISTVDVCRWALHRAAADIAAAREEAEEAQRATSGIE